MNNGDMTRLTMSFFGTFELYLGDDQVTHFRSTNNQGLLIYLVLNKDKAQPREVLAALFWPDESEQNARHNLRQALYHLRTLLGDTKNGDTPYLIVTRHSARFNPESDARLDVWQFLEAVEGHDLQTAVSHYHGDLLPGFTCDNLQFEEWLRQERESLHQLALTTLFEITREHLAANRFDQAQFTARRQLSLEPWRETAFRQLMQAYALAGDRANALAQFEECRELLWSELGVEPAAETKALFDEIEAGRYGPSRMEETLPPPRRQKHNLPSDTTPFVGRDLELAEINRLLTDVDQRLVTIVGPGGIGKTRLALASGSAIVQQFADGVYFVDLAPLAAPEEIFLAVASALEYQAPDQSSDLQPQLLDMLSRRELLLILDNFEHLIDGAFLVNDILKNCPYVTVLVTSRQRLNLASESRYELAGLILPDSVTAENAQSFTAVELFMAAARRTQSQFELNAKNVEDVVHICRLVEGIPLGLLLAASWLEMLKPAEIAAEIKVGLDFLAADLSDLPPRQRSMQAVFAGSWAMMTPAEQDVLAKLSVFRGGFTREAAQAVAGANLRVLLSLINKSLLHRQIDHNRFTMHELLRQFATEQRRDKDPLDHASLAHCRYFAQLVPGEVRQALYFYPILLPRKYAADWENFRRAWDYALAHDLALELAQLARGIIILLYRQGVQPGPTITRAVQSLQQRGHLETDHAMMHLRLDELEAVSGLQELDRDKERITAFLPLAEKFGDLQIRYWTYERLRGVYLNADSQEAFAWADKAIQVAIEMGDEVLTKASEANKFAAKMISGEHNQNYREPLQNLLTYFEPQFANSFIVYGIYWALGELDRDAKNYDRALHYGLRALNIAKYWQDLLWISTSDMSLANTYIEMGLYSEAGLQLLDNLEWHLALGQEWQTIGTLLVTAFHYQQLIGGDENAASLISLAYHHPDSIPGNKNWIESERARLEQDLGEEQFAEAWERGKTLDFETAVSQVRAALQSIENSPAKE